MALERSTKTIQDLTDFANDKMCASLNKIYEQDPGMFCAEVRHTAQRFRTKCKEEFPGILLDCNQRNLLPQSGFARLSVTTTEISHAFRPDWAVWLSVNEYLYEHGEELGL